jgi:hypothetical protein
MHRGDIDHQNAKGNCVMPAPQTQRRWSELTIMERHELHATDRTLYERLHEQHLADEEERPRLIARGFRNQQLTPKMAAYFKTLPAASLRDYLAIAPRVDRGVQ